MTGRLTTRFWIGAAAAFVAGTALAGQAAVQALPDGTIASDSSTTTSSTTTSSTTSTSTTSTSTTSTSTTLAPPVCSVLDAEVDGGTAVFTVGPAGCTGQVGPISFSTYALPGGWRQPYEAQILIAHAAGNGTSYGPGTYTLSAPIGDVCNWQSDLYRSPSDDQPPLVRLLGYDYVEGRVCDAGPSSSTPATVATSSTSEVRPTTTLAGTTTMATTSTSLVGNAGGAATTTSVATTTVATAPTQVRSGPPTVAAAPGLRGTTTSEPARSPRTGSLPSTGPSLVMGIVAIALAALVLGALMRRVAGSPRG